MEQEKCLMLVKSKHMIQGDLNLQTSTNMKRFIPQESYCSWKDHQEIAFNEDATRVWPPRSYSCTFCKREFKSAQALGGHMNVHRRDRALLKQVVFTPLNHPHNLPLNPNSMVISPNPSKSPTRVYSNVTHKQVVYSHNSTSELREQVKLGANRCTNGGSVRGDEEEETYMSFKRCKKGGDCVPLKSLLDEFKCSNVEEINWCAQEGLSLKASKSMDELDLELRLGYTTSRGEELVKV